MHVSRLRLAALIAGVLAASPAFAYSIKVTGRIAAYDDTLVPASAVVASTSGNTYNEAAFTNLGAIDCAIGATLNCEKFAQAGAAVVLEPALGANTVLAGWSGCDSVAGNQCTVNLNSNRIVTANFKPATYGVTVRTSPAPTGTFTPAYGGTMTVVGVDYRSTLANPSYVVAVPAGVATVLTATPDAGSAVKGWGGCTPGTPNTTCTLTAYGPTAVSVGFGATATNAIRAAVVGGGAIRSGSVVTAADYMNCRAGTGDCTAVGPVTLSAVADAGASFKGWTGPCTGTGATCVVSSAAYVTATFKSASTCSSCHTTNPASHGTATLNCTNCHSLANHMDGVANAAANPATALPNDGVNLAITNVTASSTQVTSVTFTVTDGAGAGLASLTGSALPTIVLGRLNDDGTYKAYYSRSATGANYLKDGVDTEEVLASANQDTSAPGTSSTTQGSAPSNFTNNGGGSYTYTFPNCGTDVATGCYTSTTATSRSTFGNPTVAAADADNVHTVGLWISRTVGQYAFRNHTFQDFRPDAGAVTVREVVSDDACNKCHGELTLHGSRRGLKSCLPCHNPTTIDPESGNNVDMATMVHKIHNGHLLVNGYEIVGHQQSYFDFGHVAMAPSHGGYLEGGGIYATAHDPGLSRECAICHDSNAAQAVNAFTRPSRRACGSCHDDVDFAVGHFPNGSGGWIVGPQASDGNCAGCHAETSIRKYHSKFYATGTTTTGVKFGVDFTTDVTPAVPAAGHKFEASIVSVANNGAGLTWTLDFKLDNAPYDITTAVTSANGVDDSFVLAACTFQLSGPNSDYVLPATGGNTGGSCATPASWTAVAGVPGRYTYTIATNWFTAAPAKADGYYTASFEMMLSRQWSPTAAADRIRKPFAADPNFVTLQNTAGTVAVVTEGVDLVARRKVVEYSKCNACHEDVGFHSNRNRQGPDYCATCHNPMLDNGGRARFTVAEAYTVPGTTTLGYLPESVSLNVFIHRIHMGSRLPSVGGRELSTFGTITGAALRSPWVADQNGAGSIVYGATRSNFVGFTATTEPEFADLSHYAQPNSMNRCEQCHIDTASKQSWALPESPGLAPIKRDYRACNPTTPSWATEPWCDVTINTGPAKVGAPVYTPPLKAVCTSCHDSLATDAHADLFTVNPMTQTATELCAGCHGAGRSFDSLDSHRRVP